MRLMRVGEVADRTGVSVRALHYYDEIGLLSASHQSEGGHRLYGGRDLSRLYRIRALQQIGLSLQEIQHCLESDDYSPLRVVELHLERLEEKIELQRKVRRRLTRLAAHLREAGDASVEEFLNTMEAMSMFDHYYSDEQREKLEERKAEVGEERIRQAEEEWKRLFRAFAEARGQGQGADAPEVAELARKYLSLIEEFTGGDRGIRESLGRMYEQEGAGNVLGRFGYDVGPELFEYIGQAVEAARREP